MALMALAFATGGCAHIPPDSYGVARLSFEGVDELSEDALRACLATRERARVGIDFGTASDATCNVPPFDGGGGRFGLWRWPWTDWPTWDLAIFERDLRRIERWYRARGYYEARVTDVEITPENAGDSDRVEDRDGEPLCEREDDDEGCRLEVTISIDEGKPVLINELEMRFTRSEFQPDAAPPPPLAASADGTETDAPADAGGPTLDDLEDTSAAEAPPPTQVTPDSTPWMTLDEMGFGRNRRIALRNAVELEVGAPFDESLYDRSKAALLEALLEGGYACAHVEGRVEVERSTKQASVRLDVHLGRACYIREVTVESGDEEVPVRTVLGAADITPGQRYVATEMRTAQRAVYGLGAFAEVDIIGTPVRDEEDVCTGQVDVTIRVRRGRVFRYGIGAGVETGRIDDAANGSVPQWDLHALVFIEHRDFLGGFRRLRLEDRPKLIMQTRTSSARRLSPGNELRLDFRQPAFLEPQTTLSMISRWDYGPDPNQGFLRHDVDAYLRLSRPFFGGKLILSGGLHWNLQRAIETDNSSDHNVLFFEQYAQLDLRDDSRRPRRGIFLSLGLQEAPRFFGLSWAYLRVTPEVRGYVPLPLGAVLAGRFSLGVMRINRADRGLDSVGRDLGPQRYRLRSGGPSSHRGFAPGFLGDVPEPGIGSYCEGNVEPPPSLNCAESNSGGLRRWEANLELRVPLTADFGVVLFGDMGDLSRGTSFRFSRIHLAVGFGIRYQTIVGPVRLDLGILVPRAQTVGGAPDVTARRRVNLGFLRFNGAIHLTIGEAF